MSQLVARLESVLSNRGSHAESDGPAVATSGRPRRARADRDSDANRDEKRIRLLFLQLPEYTAPRMKMVAKNQGKAGDYQSPARFRRARGRFSGAAGPPFARPARDRWPSSPFLPAPPRSSLPPPKAKPCFPPKMPLCFVNTPPPIYL